MLEKKVRFDQKKRKKNVSSELKDKEAKICGKRKVEESFVVGWGNARVEQKRKLKIGGKILTRGKSHFPREGRIGVRSENHEKVLLLYLQRGPTFTRFQLRMRNPGGELSS